MSWTFHSHSSRSVKLGLNFIDASIRMVIVIVIKYVIVDGDVWGVILSSAVVGEISRVMGRGQRSSMVLLNTWTGVQSSISVYAGKMRSVGCSIALIEIRPFPFSIGPIIALIVSIVKSPTSLPDVVRYVEALEVSAIGEEKMAAAVPILFNVGSVGRALSRCLVATVLVRRVIANVGVISGDHGSWGARSEIS